MKFVILCLAIFGFAGNSFGQVRVMFSHQSVGRYVVGDPERADPSKRATYPIRDFLNENVAFWDHDYYNYSTDIMSPGTNVFGSLLDPNGDIFSISGFGSHRGSEENDILMDHLVGEAFVNTSNPAGIAFRDSCTSRFDIVMIKPGYVDMHMNTSSSLASYQAMLNDVADWWHQNNVQNGTDKILVVMTASSLRHPSDYSGDSAGWPNTAAGRAAAEADAAAYKELDLWMENVWVHQYPDIRHFSTWELCVNESGSPNEKYFTKDIYTGTGAGDNSGDHHLNIAGSNALQAALITYINNLAYEYENGTSIADTLPNHGLTLYDAMPNPFNPSTVLSFELDMTAEVRLTIYDVSGNHVKTLVDEVRDEGRHQVIWDGRDRSGNRVSSGVYFYRMESQSFSRTKRMALVK